MRVGNWFYALGIGLLAGACLAATQTRPMPAAIATRLQQIGRVIDVAATAALYAPLQPSEPYAGVRIERDRSYGAADRNRLDLFMPATPSPPRPVLMFVHGGGFVGGSKHQPGSPFYDNIMLWAVTNGFIGVNLDYRLAPRFAWPAGAEDVAAAVAWTQRHISAYGGDPARLYLMGQSAGAAHVASYVSHPEFHQAKGGGLAGAILISGMYDLTGLTPPDADPAYFGWDASRYAARSSLDGLSRTGIPLMLAAAALDPPRFAAQYETLKQALCRRPRGCARSVMLPQHSHISEVYAINTADDRLTGEILDFVRSGK